MLQEKNKKEYLNGCIRLGIIIFILFILIISGFIFAIIIILFIFAGNKKTNINFQKVLEQIGVYDCFKYFFGDFKTKEILKKYEDKFNKNKKIPHSISPIGGEVATDLGNKKEKPIKQQGDFSPLYIKSKKRIKKVKYKTENNSFNSGKSIWDDYESVIDIMNKKK